MKSDTALPDMPHIRGLNVVREVFRLRRIGAAAGAVHLSQPAATQAVARVEQALGAALFERRPTGMFPTEAGALFQPRLARLFEHLRIGDMEARKKGRRGAGKPFYPYCTPVQLRALLAISKAGSFTQAAHDLGVKQPGIHRAARDLCRLAGFDLFEQRRGGVVLSAAAEVFVQHLRLAIAEFRQAIYEINELTGRDVSCINVGSLPLSRVDILPRAIHEVIHDGVQVNCVEARYDKLMRDLRFGDLDLVIGALRVPAPAADIVQEELFVDRLAVVAAPGHPLLSKAGITLDDTLDFPWIAPPKTTPTGTYLFETLDIESRAQTPVRAVSSSLVLLRGLLARGDYVSIASKRQIALEEEMGTMIQLPIPLPGSERAIGLALRKDWTPTPAQSRFLQIIRRVARG